MGRTLSNRLATLPATRREAIGSRAADLVAEELSLRELRRAAPSPELRDGAVELVDRDCRKGAHTAGASGPKR